MSDRNEQIRDAFQDGTDVPAWNRERVLTGVLQHTQQVRRRRMYRVTGFALSVTLIVALVVTQWRAIMTIIPIRSNIAPAPADSISTNPAEVAVTNEQAQGSSATMITRQEMPNLSPLLGQRSDILNDMEDLANRRDDLREALNANPGREHASQLRTELAGLDQMMASSLTTLRVVDNQIASLQGGEPLTTVQTIEGLTTDPGVVIRPLLPGQPFMYAAGISLTALLVMLASMLYMRRTIRATLDTLSSLSGQTASQMTTLTSGIEAIAIEVERLGENQRFMSKVIVGERREGAEQRST